MNETIAESCPVSPQRTTPGPVATGRRLARHVDALWLAIAAGIAVRAWHIAANPFPMNDGGMFYAMARDLRANDFVLPKFTSYNDAGIPFAYPPFGMYAAALLDALTPASLVDAFRLLPFAGSSLTVVAFALLALKLLPSRRHAAVAVLVFALIPRSYIWLLMGGGVTRAFGLAFALFALAQFVQLAREPSRRTLVLTVLFASLTVFSHLETAFFLAFSVVVLAIANRQRWRAFVHWMAAAGVLVTLVTALWWLPVIRYHGLAPLIASTRTDESLLSGEAARTALWNSLLTFTLTSEPYFPLLGVLGFAGAVLLLARRRFLLPGWWLAILVLDPRAAPTFASVPIGLMAAYGVLEVFAPALSRATAGREGSTIEPDAEPASDPAPVRTASRRPAFVLGVAAVVFAVMGALNTDSGLRGEGDLLSSLSPGERAAMTWLRDNTPAGSAILVVPSTGWQRDRVGEWLPVLAERRSVGTVQGTEWLDGGSFSRSIDQYDALWECGYHPHDCIDDWADETGEPFDYVYIPRDGVQCCDSLVTSLAESPEYRQVFDGPGGTVFERLVSATARTAPMPARRAESDPRRPSQHPEMSRIPGSVVAQGITRG